MVGAILGLICFAAPIIFVLFPRMCLTLMAIFSGSKETLHVAGSLCEEEQPLIGFPQRDDGLSHWRRTWGHGFDPNNGKTYKGGE